MSKKKLVVVESPAKINKIKSFLPNESEYIVLASYGHIMDLDPKQMAIDFDNNYEPIYTFYTDQFKISKLKLLKQSYKNCDELIIASDLDREGEFIGYSLVCLLKPKKYKRLIFNEITKSAIVKAIENPVDLDYNVINSQKCRRFLDRILGYTLSPLLRYVDELGGDFTLGCGRVQSIVIKLIIDKEREIEDFLNKSHNSFYECTGLFQLEYKDICNLECVLYNSDPKIKKFSLENCENTDNYSDCLKITKEISKAYWEVIDIKESDKYRSPNGPFITSVLQKTCGNMFGWSIKKTMEIAQKLYESGKITYMRTDSYNLSSEIVSSIKKYITDNIGKDYYKFRRYSSSNSAQEAHECIRPTNINIVPGDDNNDYEKLYKLIWKRTVACLMTDAMINIKKFYIIPLNSKKKQIRDLIMVGSLNTVKFDGFLLIIPDDSYDSNFKLKNLEDYKDIKVTCLNIKMKENIKSPPLRYNQSGLVQKMEELSIGRPATYVASITKIIEKDYVEEVNITGVSKEVREIIYEKDNKIEEKIVTKKIGNENKKLVPCKTGINIVNFLVNNFSDIMEINYSANLETKLDLVSNGSCDFIEILDNFRNKLEKEKERFLENKEPVKYVGGNKNDTVICKYKDEDIVYTKTKAKKKVLRWKNLDNDTVVWADCSSRPDKETAIKLIEDKIEVLKTPKEPSSKLIKTIGEFLIKNGPYGNYIQYKTSGKKGKIAFCSLKNIDINNLDENQCKDIIEKNKKYKK